MASHKFNPARLSLARRRRGMTKVQLAEAVSLTSRRIAGFENQGDLPPASTLSAIASALDFPEPFFFKPSPPDPTVDGVSFRSFARLAASRRDAAVAASAIAIELADYLDQRYRLPTVDLPDLRDVDARTAALAVRSAWGVGDRPLPNGVHLLEAHGVGVYSLVDECADLDAFSFWYQGRPFVFLTTHKSPERGRWDAVHELAHLVLHQGISPHRRELEREADDFASEFLLPASGVMTTAPRFVSLREVREEKLRWRVSALAYIRRLYQLERITERRYKSLVVEASQAGYRRIEGDIDREASKTVPMLMALLAEDGIHISDIASELSVTSKELRGLLFSTMRSVPGGGPSGRPGPRHLRAVV